MVVRNPNFTNLATTYLFKEIERRKALLLNQQPDAKLISLGIGDTTLPIADPIADALSTFSKNLATKEGYRGYGPAFGDPTLRKKIAESYSVPIDPDDVFISDGAKPDIARLQYLFPYGATIGIQDPAYPVYADTTLMSGKKLITLACTPENDFFPSDFSAIDLLIICSPNNPTGTVATKAQLQKSVEWAKNNKKIILFDAAYSAFIQDPELPRSIFEIEGANEVAIEMNSFSKMAGFTGVRLGWTVVPKTLKFDDGSSVHADWSRIVSTCFNGASIISQAGAMAALEKDAQPQIQKNIKSYLSNANVIRDTLHTLGATPYGGEHIPYIWAYFPESNCWDIFETILHEAHVVTTPGAGFGPSGEGFVRFSGFATPEKVQEACERLKKLKLAPKAMK